MKLSRLTEEFLKYIIEIKKPKDFVFIQERDLPENLKSHIFGLGDELDDAKLIKNLRKSGSPGNRGIDFSILPRAFSYFEDDEQKQQPPTQTNYFNSPVVIGSGNITAADSSKIDISPKEEKKSWFEKYGFRIILAIIAGLFIIGAAIIGLLPKISLTPTITLTSTSTMTPTLTNTPTQTLNTTPEASACSFSNGSITVAVIDLRPNYKYEDIFIRLEALGLSPTWVSPTASYVDFSEYDIVYLPSGWAIKESKLELNDDALKNYVEKGGGLLVEQPNSDKPFSPGFLPYFIKYTTDKMNIQDWPLNIFDNSTHLTKGLSEDELPGPMDCADMDTSYAPLVKGSKTGCISLAITSYGAGRIVISMGNASPSMEKTGNPMISDEALCRMIGWLAKEYDQ
jgi:hypothetical protein